MLNAEFDCPYLPVFYCTYILCAEWGDFRPSLHVVFEMLNVVIAIYIMPALHMFITVYKDECENVAYSVPSFYDVYCIWFLLC